MSSLEEYQGADTCLKCGACCATFRVSFYWAEAAVNGLPDESVEKISPALVCMAGTNQPEPRCHSLAGWVGQAVRCTVHAQRPGPCRDLIPGDEKCSRARLRHGLPELSAP